MEKYVYSSIKIKKEKVPKLDIISKVRFISRMDSANVLKLINAVGKKTFSKGLLRYVAENSTNSPFRYPGGKFYARKLILELIPIHKVYVEPLCGGASIFFAKRKAEFNILNDIDKDLTNCLIQIRDHPNQLADFLEGTPATKELHKYFKEEFKPKNNIERAARWFYLNRTSYSGIMKKENCFWGYDDKFSMRPENWRRQIILSSAKLKKVKILSKDFEKIIDSCPDNSFLFLDPPYFNRDQDKFYSSSFTKQDHLRLMEALKRNSKRIKFLLTYDNEPEIRKLYSWATEILEKEWNYTIYRTDDQTKEKSKNNVGKRYKGKEIFILNYTPPVRKLINLN